MKQGFCGLTSPAMSHWRKEQNTKTFKKNIRKSYNFRNTSYTGLELLGCFAFFAIMPFIGEKGNVLQRQADLCVTSIDIPLYNYAEQGALSYWSS